MVLVWDIDNLPAKPNTLTCDQGTVGALGLTADGVSLFAGTKSGAIVRWDLTKPISQASLFIRQPSPVYAVSLTPDGKHLAAGGDNEAWVWDLSKPSDPPQVLSGHTGLVSTVALTPDGMHLASGGQDGTVRVWDLSKPSDPPRVFVGHTGVVGCVVLTPDLKTLATGGLDDRTVRFWDLSRSDAPPVVHRSHATGVNSIALARDKAGFRLATASLDLLALWDLSNLKADPLPLGEGLTASFGCLAFSSDGGGLVVGGVDGFVRVWNFRPAYLLNLVKHNVGRNFTADEWQEFLPDRVRSKTFTDLP